MFTRELAKLIESRDITVWSMYYLDPSVLTRVDLHEGDVKRNFSFGVNCTASLVDDERKFITQLNKSRDVEQNMEIGDFRFCFEIESVTRKEPLTLYSEATLKYFKYGDVVFTNDTLSRFFAERVSSLTKTLHTNVKFKRY